MVNLINIYTSLVKPTELLGVLWVMNSVLQLSKTCASVADLSVC